MYDQFYNFTSDPFRLSPDPSFAYPHKGFTKARAYMTYAFMRAEGFVMITGRPGTGKTTLIGTLVGQLEGKNVHTAHLVCTQLRADDLLKLVAYEFGVSPAITEKGELLQRLTQQFKSWHREGKRSLLIVDEAQDLSISAMEELRLLTNIQINAKPLLQIFLLGQPELRKLMLRPELEQIHQRVIAASHLQPLSIEETEAYIRHRLEVVGWRADPLISRTIYPLIHKFSEGVPRRINLICSRVLLHCAVEESHRVGVSDMREIIGELQDEQLAAGAELAPGDFDLPDIFDETPGPEDDMPVPPPRDEAAAPAEDGEITDAITAETVFSGYVSDSERARAQVWRDDILTGPEKPESTPATTMVNSPWEDEDQTASGPFEPTATNVAGGKYSYTYTGRSRRKRRLRSTALSLLVISAVILLIWGLATGFNLSINTGATWPTFTE